jgi:hypothetical protein
VSVEPFNLLDTLMFLRAIVHTFLVSRFRHQAHLLEHEYESLAQTKVPRDKQRTAELYRLRFRATISHFLGEVEAVFGIWLIPLFIAIWSMKGFSTAVHYIDGVNYSVAIFVTVIMAMAASRPVIMFAERCLAPGGAASWRDTKRRGGSRSSRAVRFWGHSLPNLRR